MIDIGSPTWLTIKAHCEIQVRELMEKLTQELTPVETWATRGKITAIRHILKLGNGEPPDPAGSSSIGDY